MQKRFERRHNIVTAAALTAIPFAAIHLPLQLVGDITVTSVLIGMAALLAYAVVLRLFIALVQRGAASSILAVGLLHSIHNESNNSDGLGDKLLNGVNQNYAAVLAIAVLTLILGAVTWARTRQHNREDRSHRHRPAAGGGALG